MSKFWETNYLNKYNQIFHENSNDWISHENIILFDEAKKDYDKELNNYKINHNKFLYGCFISIFIPLSILTIIPAYWTIKKFKELKANKNNLEIKVQKAKEHKLSIHKKIYSETKFISICKLFNNIINYKHCGPIPQKLVDSIQELSLFDLRSNNDSNTYKTSWGIIDNNKILINVSKQNHTIYNKTYQGSVTVPYRYYNSSTKSYETRFDTVTAYYTHPAVKIDNSYKSYTFLESCSNLEFKYDGKSGKFKSKRYNKKNNYSALENSTFDSEFNWSRNDETQFRMVFTPLAQENYLIESNNGKDIPNYLEWSKHKCFMTTNYSLPLNTIEFCIHNSCFPFLNDEKLNINQYKEKIKDGIIDFYFNFYKRTNYIWLTSLLQSEDQTTIINSITKSKRKVSDKNASLFGFNLLSELFNKKAIAGDTDTFHILEEYIEQGDDLSSQSKFKFKGITYNIQKKVAHVSAYSSLANRTVIVDVPYDDFIPKYGECYIYSKTLENCDNKSYTMKETNITDQNLLNKIKNLFTKYSSINFNNGIVSIYSENENDAILGDLNTL